MAFDCDHCENSFDSRREEINHILDEHRDDITSHKRDELKRERKQLPEKENGGRINHEFLKSSGVTVMAILLLVGGGYALFATGVVDFSTSADGDPSNPANFGAYGSTHEHGEMSLVIDGEQIDTDQPQYTDQYDLVHIHAGQADILHKHGTGVTYGFFFDTIDMEIYENEDDVLCMDHQGDVYCDDEGELSITLNGQEIEEPEDINHQEIQGVEQVQNAAAAGGDDLQIEYTSAE